MPPLNYYLDIKLLRSLTIGKNLVVGNDCSILHGLLDEKTTVALFKNDGCNKPIQGSVCMTIGTSFGISVKTDSSFKVSLEMAHIPISCILGMSPIHATYTNDLDASLNLCSVLNSKYLLSCHKVVSDKEGDDINMYKEINAVLGLIIGASVLASKLLGINTYDIYIVSGIKKVLLEITTSCSASRAVSVHSRRSTTHE